MARRLYLWCDTCAKVVYVGGDVEPLKTDTLCVHKSGLARVGRTAAPLTRYFEGPEGQVSVPGRADSPMPKRLKALGYTERTIQDSHQYSAFCRKMDKEAREKHDALVSARDEQFSAKQKEARSELRRQIQTQFGKDYLEAAIAASEKGYGERYDPGSHLEGFEYDHSRD